MIAALVNAGWLLSLAILVAAGSMRRLVAGAGHVHGLAVLIISSVAALVMLLGAFILRGDGDDTDLNMRAVLLDTAADAAAAAGVAIVGAIIYIAQGAYWLDPLAALAIAAVVGYHAAKLLLEVIESLRRPINRRETRGELRE